MLADDEARMPSERRSLKAIYQILREEHHYGGAYTAVCRYCRSVQIPRIELHLRPSGAEATIDSLKIVRSAKNYVLDPVVGKGTATVTLHLHRDRRAERKREAADWIERLRGDRLEQPIRGDPAAVALLLRGLHAPQRRGRNRAIAALSHEQGFSNNQIATGLGISRNTSRRYRRIYMEHGAEGLLAPRRRGTKKAEQEDLKAAVFRLLHEPPRDHGINRTSWTMRDLRAALADNGHYAGGHVVSQIIRDAGWKWKKAKIVLTSNDPDFRVKLEALQSTLGKLKPSEAFFSIDEFGPFAVKAKPGRMLDPPGRQRVVPQWQKSKGCLIMTAALELSSNQVTHFYSPRKDTAEMIRMMDALLVKYADRETIYLSWDAASWHISKKLRQRIEEHNAAAATAGGPRVETTPLPAGAQFLNVIESVFSGMARAVIHNSDFASADEACGAIDRYFADRNAHFHKNPKRAGKAIWGKELVPAVFSDSNNCKDPRWR